MLQGVKTLMIKERTSVDYILVCQSIKKVATPWRFHDCTLEFNLWNLNDNTRNNFLRIFLHPSADIHIFQIKKNQQKLHDF